MTTLEEIERVFAILIDNEDYLLSCFKDNDTLDENEEDFDMYYYHDIDNIKALIERTEEVILNYKIKCVSYKILIDDNIATYCHHIIPSEIDDQSFNQYNYTEFNYDSKYKKGYFLSAETNELTLIFSNTEYGPMLLLTSKPKINIKGAIRCK